MQRTLSTKRVINALWTTMAGTELTVRTLRPVVAVVAAEKAVQRDQRAQATTATNPRDNRQGDLPKENFHQSIV